MTEGTISPLTSPSNATVTSTAQSVDVAAKLGRAAGRLLTACSKIVDSGVAASEAEDALEVCAIFRGIRLPKRQDITAGGLPSSFILAHLCSAPKLPLQASMRASRRPVRGLLRQRSSTQLRLRQHCLPRVVRLLLTRRRSRHRHSSLQGSRILDRGRLPLSTRPLQLRLFLSLCPLRRLCRALQRRMSPCPQHSHRHCKTSPPFPILLAWQQRALITRLLLLR
jgi:hypothetical protein